MGACTYKIESKACNTTNWAFALFEVFGTLCADLQPSEPVLAFQAICQRWALYLILPLTALSSNN